MNSAAPMLTELGPKFSLPMCQYRLHATAPPLERCTSQHIAAGPITLILHCKSRFWELRHGLAQGSGDWGGSERSAFRWSRQHSHLIRMSPTTILSATLGPK